MEHDSLRSRVVVSGAGTTRFGAIAGYNALDFGALALREALLDAALPANAIDGLIVARIPDNTKFAESTGIRPDFSLVLPPTGRMAGVAIELACMAIAAGRARRIALVYGNDGKSAGVSYGGSNDPYGGGPLWEPYGMTSPGAFHALMYSRYMHETDANRSHLAEVAVAFRQHAALNPAAVMRNPITPEDHAAARPIAAPLHLLDYCLVNDGGVALILSDAALAGEGGRQPVYIRGCRQASHFEESSFPPSDYWRGAMGRAGTASYEEAGARPADMSGLMIYDNFTPTVLFSLEGFGYCAPRTAWREIQDGRLRLGGRWQANSSGGHLSESYMQGWALNAEAVRQLRGDVPDRAMAGAELIHVMTAAPQCSSIIYGVEP
jgi:acetyl-CoA acetyltransferase